MTGSREAHVMVTSTCLAVGGVKARPSDWLVIRVAALAFDDPAGPAAQAARLLADSGYLVPMPRPITATWTGDDEERTRRVLTQVGASVEEIAIARAEERSQRD